MNKDEEKHLLEKLRRAEARRQAFEELVRAYQQPLYRHLRHMLSSHADADDALQNTFLKAWKNLEQFRGDSSIYTWLYRIASNEALGMLRQSGRRIQLQVESEEESLPASAPGLEADADFILGHLQAALQTLPPRQRQVFDLRYFEEMPYQEIARITGKSKGALKASYHHAVKKIEHFLEQLF